MEKKGLTRPQLATMTIAAGICVANIYYNQPLLKDMARDLHVDERSIGLIPVLTQTGYALGLFFLTPLGDKMRRKKLILYLLGLLILALTGMSLAPGLTAIYVMCLLTGTTAVIAQVILPMAAGMDPENKGRNVGIIFTGILTGILAARVFSGYIATWLNWRWVYGLSAIMVLIAGIFLQAVLPDVPRTFDGSYAKLLNSTLQQVKRFPQLRRTACLGALAFGVFCSFWTTLTFHLSGPPFHYPTDIIGLFGLLAIGGALLAPVFGKLADKRHPARAQVITIGLIITAVLLVMWWPDSLASTVVAVLLLDIGVQATQVTNVATIYTLDAAAHSRINTVYMTTYFLGGSIGTFAGVQCWHTGGWQSVTWQLLLFGVVALGLALAQLRRARAVAVLLLLCWPGAALFSQEPARVFELTSPKSQPQKVPYKLIAFLDSRWDTSAIGHYTVEGAASTTKLTLKTPVQPQLEAILNAYADASSGYGAVLFQLKRFSFAETQKTTYCYLSATLYALKDNGYVPLSDIDTTLVIAGAADLYPVLQKAANDAIDNFIAKGILSAPADSVVYSYNDVQHIDSVKKRRIKVYNTSTYTEGFYSTYTAFRNQAPDLQGEVKTRGDGSMAVTLHSPGWTEARGKIHIFALVYKGIPYIVTHFGYYKLEKQGDDLYFTGRLNVEGAQPASLGIFGGSNTTDRSHYRVLIDYTNGEFIHLKALDADKPI